MKVTNGHGLLWSFSSASFLLFALLGATTDAEVTAPASIDPVLPVCKTVGGGSAYFDVEFCASALGSDGRSRGADSYRSFSAIAVDLVTANATATAAKISGLIREGGGHDDATMARCLGSCQALYGDMVRRQPGCAAAVKGGRFGEAAAALETSASAARECEDGFGKSNVTSPLTVENDSAFKLAKLAVALLRFNH
ncbi:hypothetical protein ACP70R_020142 [Stipagrostis hirtigluma subsp. patula]